MGEADNVDEVVCAGAVVAVTVVAVTVVAVSVVKINDEMYCHILIA